MLNLNILINENETNYFVPFDYDNIEIISCFQGVYLQHSMNKEFEMDESMLKLKVKYVYKITNSKFVVTYMMTIKKIFSDTSTEY